MAGALPTVFGAEAQYPVTKTISFLTSITTSRNGTEQRRMVRPPLVKFELRFNRMNYTDMLAFQTHFLANFGAAGSGITFTLFGVTYSNLYLTSDQFQAQRNVLSYNLPVSLAQSIPYTTSYGTPMVNSSSAGWEPPFEVPYMRGFMHRTYSVTQPSGPRYTLGAYAGTIRNYPSAPFGIWELKFPKASVDDAARIETAFLKQRGRLLTFSMRDPETIGATAAYFQNCRFDTDDLTQTYMEDGSVSLSLAVRTVNV